MTLPFEQVGMHVGRIRTDNDNSRSNCRTLAVDVLLDEFSKSHRTDGPNLLTRWGV